MEAEAPDDRPSAEVLRLQFAQGPIGSSFALAGEFRDLHTGQLVPTSGRLWRRYEEGAWHLHDADLVRGELWAWLEQRCQAKGGAKKKLVDEVFDAACTLPDWRLDTDSFDADLNLLAFRNGVLRLDTMELLGHSPDHHLTFYKPFDYDPDAECPKWLRFVADVLVSGAGVENIGLHRVIQEWFGYCVGNYRRCQVACVLLGEGQNGKGTMQRVLTAQVGEPYVGSVDLATIGHEYTVAACYGKRVVCAAEFPSRAMVDDAGLKWFTGGEPMPARHPYGKQWNARATAAVMVSCNALPSTSDHSKGFYRRLLIVPFHATVPDDAVDSDLADKLIAESSGIFNWALVGLKHLEAARWRFSKADLSTEVMDTYRTDGDSVALWASECLSRDDGQHELSGKLYASYAKFCRESGLKPCSTISMAKRLKAALPWAVTGKRLRSNGQAQRVVYNVIIDEPLY